VKGRPLVGSFRPRATNVHGPLVVRIFVPLQQDLADPDGGLDVSHGLHQAVPRPHDGHGRDTGRRYPPLHSLAGTARRVDRDRIVEGKAGECVLHEQPHRPAAGGNKVGRRRPGVCVF
jgi:hypothetical protein